MKVPEQVSRIGTVLVLIVVAVVALRFSIIPQSYFSMPLHRMETMQREAAQPTVLAGSVSCRECHDEIYALKATGFHKTLGCESCHSPSAAHAEDPEAATPTAPRDRKHCPVCHAYDSARPTGFPQINPRSHNPLKACITCHNPHAPVPPHAPAECSAWHGQIARTKELSSHALLECSTCHAVSKEHKIHPRSSLPTKPQTREFCGGCHAKGATNPDSPKVDMDEHGESYLCWQCHYPHLPEGN